MPITLRVDCSSDWPPLACCGNAPRGRQDPQLHRERRRCDPLCSGLLEAEVPEGAVLIPPGTFVMGSDTAFAISDHSPAHRVTLTKNYCIDRTEVTMGAFARCVRAKKCEYDDTILDMGRMKPNWPMDFVNWQDADHYCRAQGGRLPTDAEWEFAARGTDGRIYPWGNDPRPRSTGISS
ncbi:MAG TPA: SUMF1/EgtB/PvdO family nonheme iron enzyme [Polyangiaceae bacterium]|nr:SUMF1/EgtB/PvdO family nonheme iron enzyme [Polyangiaceae bacterium]